MCNYILYHTRISLIHEVHLYESLRTGNVLRNTDRIEKNNKTKQEARVYVRIRMKFKQGLNRRTVFNRWGDMKKTNWNTSGLLGFPTCLTGLFPK